MFPKRRSQQILFKQQESSSSSSRQTERLTNSNSTPAPVPTSGLNQNKDIGQRMVNGNGSGLPHSRMTSGLVCVVRDCGKQSEATQYYPGTYRPKSPATSSILRFLFITLLSINLYLNVCVQSAPVLEPSTASIQKRELSTLTELDEPSFTSTLKRVDDENDSMRSKVEPTDNNSKPRQEYEELSGDLVILLDNDNYDEQQQAKDPAATLNSSSSFIRRLIKRSGISDQRLAEMQMMRALRKQLERASKIAASNLNSAAQGNENTS